MPGELTRKISLNDLRRARDGAGAKIAMLTCYDYTTAKLMQQAGVPALLVGDSAGNVILGHPTTIPVSLSFMIEIAAGVRLCQTGGDLCAIGSRCRACRRRYCGNGPRRFAPPINRTRRRLPNPGAN